MLIRSYVGVMCEDCQMMRETASVTHGFTGRAVADSPRPRDDDDDDDDAAAAVRWGHALEYPRVATCTYLV